MVTVADHSLQAYRNRHRRAPLLVGLSAFSMLAPSALAYDGQINMLPDISAALVATPPWTPLYEQGGLSTGTLAFDDQRYGFFQVLTPSGNPGGGQFGPADQQPISGSLGVYCNNFMPAGSGTRVNIQMAIIGITDGSVLWSSGPITCTDGQTGIPFNFTVGPFTPPADGLLQTVYQSNPVPGTVASVTSDENSGGFWLQQAATVVSLTPAQKQQYKIDADAAKALSQGLGAASRLAAAKGAPVKIRMGISAAAAMASEAAVAYSRLAADPPNPDYMTYAVAGTLPPINTNNSCLSDLGKFLSDVWGNATAAADSYDKLGGAIAAGDQVWITNQGQEMLGYASAVDNDQASFQSKFSCLPEILNGNDITTTDINIIKADFMKNGLPQYIINGMTAGGMSTDDINTWLNNFITANSVDIANGFNAMFANDKSSSWNAL